VNEGQAGEVGQADTDIAGVGIITVQNIGSTRLAVKPGVKLVGEGIKMAPELLLGKAKIRPGSDAYDASLAIEWLNRPAVIRRHVRIPDAASDQIHLANGGLTGQSPGELHNVILVCPPVSASRPSCRFSPRISPWMLIIRM
jgi:hypothetical protein